MALYINGNKTGGGGGNADIVHLTQSEYDALPDSKLTDDKVYMITDVNGDGSQFQPVIYSENEREIGVWTDGKPLYEKTIHTGALSTGDYSVAHNIFNLDDLISAYGNFIYAGKKSPIPINSRNNINWNLTVADVSSTMINFEVGTNYNNTYAITDSYITLQYTKTTDTAGSGTWTPQGVPAVHYSTDEQVVGTWIDGNTLYEKTFSFIPTDNNFYIDVTNLNIDKIINSNGSIFQSYGNVVPLPYGTTSTDFAIAYYDSNNKKLKISEASGQDNYNLNVQWIVTWKYTKSSQGGN